MDYVQNFSGRCPGPRWGAHSAPQTPSWIFHPQTPLNPDPSTLLQRPATTHPINENRYALTDKGRVGLCKSVLVFEKPKVLLVCTSSRTFGGPLPSLTPLLSVFARALPLSRSPQLSFILRILQCLQQSYYYPSQKHRYSRAIHEIDPQCDHVISQHRLR